MLKTISKEYIRKIDREAPTHSLELFGPLRKKITWAFLSPLPTSMASSDQVREKVTCCGDKLGEVVTNSVVFSHNTSVFIGV